MRAASTEQQSPTSFDPPRHAQLAARERGLERGGAEKRDCEEITCRSQKGRVLGLRRGTGRGHQLAPYLQLLRAEESDLISSSRHLVIFLHYLVHRQPMCHSHAAFGRTKGAGLSYTDTLGYMPTCPHDPPTGMLGIWKPPLHSRVPSMKQDPTHNQHRNAGVFRNATSRS